MLDAIVVSCAAGAPDQKQLEFIVGVARTLRLPNEKLEWLVKLARVLMEQDGEEYQKLSSELPNELRDEFLPKIACYLK